MYQLAVRFWGLAKPSTVNDSGMSNVPKQSRQRDIFPLAPLGISEHKLPEWDSQRWGVLRCFANAVIGALNWCYGCKLVPDRRRHRTAAQSDVVHRVVARSVEFYLRLQKSQPGSWESFTPNWVPLPDRPSGPKYGDLRAEAVDVLPQAGVCDPTPCLPEHVQQIVNDEVSMFSVAPDGLAKFSGMAPEDKAEYVKLVVRQLRAKQLGLTERAKGGGAVIAVGKPGGQRQRAVWHGRRVSAAAIRPPKPRHLASPTALTFLECGSGKGLRCSKRDASCWFDQLRLPTELQRWMGRPRVSLRDLCSIGGMTIEEVQTCLLPGESHQAAWFYPVSLTWPMGFAWSSYIAQEVLLNTCHEAGMRESQVLSCEASTPLSFSLVFAAATDDVMIFSDEGEGHTLKAARQLDAELSRRGAIRNTAKDVDDELCATCVGVSLEDGTHLGVPPARCLSMIVTVLYLLKSQKASPKQVHQQLGVQQWFDLLQRCKLSVYDQVYAFVRDPQDTCARLLPKTVMFELAVGMLLGVFWRLDLQKPFLPLLSATDASTTHGFGASVAQLPIQMVRRLARVAEKQGDYVVMDGGTVTGAQAKRLGEAHHLDISMGDFVDIFSVKARKGAHINVLEGEAFLIWLRWVLRSRRRHCSRLVVLVDSAVWLAVAAAKGRSSTQLNRLLRKAATLELAGELQVYLVLVPSAENPSDWPSRGVRRIHGSSMPLNLVPCNSPK